MKTHILIPFFISRKPEINPQTEIKHVKNMTKLSSSFYAKSSPACNKTFASLEMISTFLSRKRECQLSGNFQT